MFARATIPIRGLLVGYETALTEMDCLAHWLLFNGKALFSFQILTLDGCTVDFSRAEVDKDGEFILLTAMEHKLLETLAKNEGWIVTVDTLREALWSDNPFGYLVGIHDE